MHLQIGDDLRTVHNAQLVYSNRQDIALTLLTGFKIWLVHNCQTEEDHLNIKIVTALLLYNACTLLNMMEICVTNNNKLKIHPRGMATFKKIVQSTSEIQTFGFQSTPKTEQMLVRYRGVQISNVRD